MVAARYKSLDFSRLVHCSKESLFKPCLNLFSFYYISRTTMVAITAPLVVVALACAVSAAPIAAPESRRLEPRNPIVRAGAKAVQTAAQTGARRVAQASPQSIARTGARTARTGDRTMRGYGVQPKIQEIVIPHPAQAAKAPSPFAKSKSLLQGAVLVAAGAQIQNTVEEQWNKAKEARAGKAGQRLERRVVGPNTIRTGIRGATRIANQAGRSSMRAARAPIRPPPIIRLVHAPAPPSIAQNAALKKKATTVGVGLTLMAGVGEGYGGNHSQDFFDRIQEAKGKRSLDERDLGEEIELEARGGPAVRAATTVAKQVGRTTLRQAGRGAGRTAFRQPAARVIPPPNPVTPAKPLGLMGKAGKAYGKLGVVGQIGLVAPVAFLAGNTESTLQNVPREGFVDMARHPVANFKVGWNDPKKRSLEDLD
ncbi:hypothetical protein C8J56DRAFT_910467 [Mycena floridula]|nr:hypothetical protein C8J56DRAFT_910467 [Mycena floridula]